MTAAGQLDRVISDPIGLIVELVISVERALPPEQVRTVVTSVAGGRAKSRRLAAALAQRVDVLVDGGSPAPLAIGELMVALRDAGAQRVSLPRCVDCGRASRYQRRRGQHWYCVDCIAPPETCVSCGNARRVHARDQHGRPRCRKCPITDERDPVDVIHVAVLAVDSTASRETVADAVYHSAAKPSSRRKLAREIEAAPRLLTGDGHRAALSGVLRLIDRLIESGVTGVVRPSCSRCHRLVRLDRPLDGEWVCRNCVAKARVETCFRCGVRRQPCTRDDQGNPLCSDCFISDPANLDVCARCGRRRPVSIRTTTGPLCPSCIPRQHLICSICDRTAPSTISLLTGNARCRACAQRRAECSRCNKIRSIHSGTLDTPICGPCTDPAPGRWQPCPGCGTADRVRAIRDCPRCVLRRHLDGLLTDQDGLIKPHLQPLHQALASVDRPRSAMQWLATATVSALLSDFATGRRSLTHQALDELPISRPLNHLRSVLVATDVLPTRDEHLARIERVIHDMVAAHADPDGRQILSRYALWHRLRRLRNRTADNETTHEQAIVVRQQVRAASQFLTWLANQNLTLDTCRQPDLERWLTSDTASLREAVGGFIRWARSSKATHHLSFPARRWTGPTQALDHDARWRSARQLLHDNTLSTEDRFAGLLLLLYAQQIATICHLTTDDVLETDDTVRIRLGERPITLPEPVATLATQHVATRRSRAMIPHASSHWLFPGKQPGRPISTSAMNHRLRKLGIQPGQARSTALFQLATELPAALLSRTLGIHISVATTWQRATSGDWTHYAAEVSQRHNTRE